MTQDDICKAYLFAQQVHGDMMVAYWANENRSVFEMKYNDAHDAFKRLAEVMGYNVEVKE